MAEGIFKADGPDDPNRCQGVNSQGQCINKAVQLPSGKYGTFCLCHGGNKQVESEQKNDKRLYQLGKWQRQLEEQAEHVNIKSLREEIGILRVVMQERWSVIKDTTDLILASGPITDLVMKIEKLVASCHKLEGSMGQLLDKQAILNFASQVVAVVSEVLNTITCPHCGKAFEGTELIQKIGDKIIKLVGNMSTEDE